MGQKYFIAWQMPEDYTPWKVLEQLPSPISREMTEIYNYSVEESGFHFLDHLVNEKVAGHAMKLFVDEALAYTDHVTICKL